MDGIRELLGGDDCTYDSRRARTFPRADTMAASSVTQLSTTSGSHLLHRNGHANPLSKQSAGSIEKKLPSPTALLQNLTQCTFSAIVYSLHPRSERPMILCIFTSATETDFVARKCVANV